MLVSSSVGDCGVDEESMSDLRIASAKSPSSGLCMTGESFVFDDPSVNSGTSTTTSSFSNVSVRRLSRAGKDSLGGCSGVGAGDPSLLMKAGDGSSGMSPGEKRCRKLSFIPGSLGGNGGDAVLSTDVSFEDRLLIGGIDELEPLAGVDDVRDVDRFQSFRTLCSNVRSALEETDCAGLANPGIRDGGKGGGLGGTGGGGIVPDLSEVGEVVVEGAVEARCLA